MQRYVCVCLLDGHADTLWDYECDFGPEGGWSKRKRGSNDSWVLNPTLEVHTIGQQQRSEGGSGRPATRPAASCRHEQQEDEMCVLKRRKCVLFGPFWWQFSRFRVDDLQTALCLLAFYPSGRFITTESVTADWHPDFTRHTSQLWRHCPPPPLSRDGLRPPLCDAAGWQSCDLWSRKNT